jgi:Probable zinc-ribbon domain
MEAFYIDCPRGASYGFAAAAQCNRNAVTSMKPKPGRKAIRGAPIAKRRDALQARLAAAHEAALLRGRTTVNATLLAPDNSYSTPDYVMRGYYLDKPFTCKDCGKPEVWSATQQKWWYETAKGGVWTMSTRCRACRRRERERRNEARRVHLEGVARKKKNS